MQAREELCCHNYRLKAIQPKYFAESCVHLVESLLAAIIREDGESLVLHVGERPVVVSGRGPREVTASPMTLEGMLGLLSDLLPADAERALAEYGAVESELQPSQAAPGERFTVVAARGGDDVWIELRRKRGAPAGTSESKASAGTAASAPRSTRKMADAQISVEAATPEPAVVLPLSRTGVRPEPPTRPLTPRTGGLERLLRTALARGAEALYLFSNARPSIRVDGEIITLEGEGTLGSQDVEALVLEVLPDRLEAGGLITEREWICEIKDVGRVRCLAFGDHRGPGGIFRMIPARAISAEQLGLSREIQGLCAEPEGLVLVTGPRASGKSTLLAAFVDLISRTRSDYVITVESRVRVVHDNRMGIVSQREVRGGAHEWLATIRGALRENPDVLVVEDLRAPEVAAEAIEAAASGYLVIAGIPAHSAPEAVTRLIEQALPERRSSIQAALAETLRGVVTQVLLRKSAGGRIAARELLLGTPSVSSLIAEGKLAQLPLALDSGRRHGMVPLTDALVAFIQSGVIDVREAWRKSSNRAGLLKQLKREGIDTTVIERLA
jgi:twitching motility protein PilT